MTDTPAQAMAEDVLKAIRRLYMKPKLTEHEATTFVNDARKNVATLLSHINYLTAEVLRLTDICRTNLAHVEAARELAASADKAARMLVEAGGEITRLKGELAAETARADASKSALECEIAKIGRLQARLSAAEARADRLKLEAQCHAGEARAANATIAEIYQICTDAKGEPGNWNGAKPVRALKLRLDAALSDVSRLAHARDLETQRSAELEKRVRTPHCELQIGDKVRIASTAPWASDWRGWEGWIVSVEMDNRALNRIKYSVSDVWPPDEKNGYTTDMAEGDLSRVAVAAEGDCT